MLLESIRIGDRTEITLKREKKIEKSYVSQVEEIHNEKQLVVHTPISYGQIIKLPEMDNYEFLFFTEKGMILFDATILEYVEYGGRNLMIVKILSSGERIQRREFFRFDCVLPFEFKNSRLENADGIIKDIGGGGIRFVTNEELEQNEQIVCLLRLDSDLLEVTGNILHKQYFPKSSYKYQYRIQFKDISAFEREIINQFIFNEQKKKIKRNGVII